MTTKSQFRAQFDELTNLIRLIEIEAQLMNLILRISGFGSRPTPS